MPVSEVRPNAELFKQLVGDTKQGTVVARWGISIGTLRNLLDGVVVTRSTIENLAGILNRPITDLFLPRVEEFIPSDVKYFESLKYGWYIDNDRRRNGNAKWFKESVELKVVDQSSSTGVLRVEGKIVNDFGVTFEVTGARLGDHHFSLSGGCIPSRLGLDAMFSRQMDGVLCGIWSGINHLELDIAVYRMFLSPHVLTKTQIKTYSAEARISKVVETEEFGYEGE